MKGHIRKRGERSWSIVVDLGRGPDGKRKQKWHTVHGTKKDAERELARILHELDSGVYIEPSKMSVGEYLEHWLDAYAKTSVSPKTYERYAGIVRKNVVPQLGHIQLTKLQPMQVQKFYSWSLQHGRLRGSGGLSEQSVVHIHRVLRKAFRQAVKWQLLGRNPIEAVSPPRVSHQEMRVLNPAEIEKLLVVLDDHPMRVPVIVALATGLRRGELLALRWSDVDISHRKLTVTRSLEQTKDGVTVKEPKTPHSRRTISLPEWVITPLKMHHVDQERRELVSTHALNEGDFVFPNEDGEMWSPDRFTSLYRSAVRGSDFQDLRFHDLRHTHATVMLLANVHPKVVSGRLGHSTVAITLNTYSHVLPSMDEEAAGRLDAALPNLDKGGGESIPEPSERGFTKKTA